MKITGVITEYNPFHNGHKYHLEKARELTDADYLIVVMSGNFTQRGTPAIIHKYARAQMALENGADLVLELPVSYACQSAEYFARGGVALLDRLGVVDSLFFGSECGTIAPLQQLAYALNEESSVYTSALKEALKSGFSYPHARNHALLCANPDLSLNPDVLTSPNNILGMEYIRVLLNRNSSITPVTTVRKGSGYHDEKLGEGNSSALAIRTALLHKDSLQELKDQVPPNVYALLLQEWHHTFPIYTQDFSQLLHYKLLSEQTAGFTAYMDVSADLSRKIMKHLPSYTDYESFCERLKSKDMTYTRISRCLLHILLNIKKADIDSFAREDTVCYARILGFRPSSVELLHQIKKQASIPLLSKLAHAHKQVSPIGNIMLEQDILAAHIYDAVTAHKFGGNMQNEYRRRIIRASEPLS